MYTKFGGWGEIKLLPVWLLRRSHLNTRELDVQELIRVGSHNFAPRRPYVDKLINQSANASTLQYYMFIDFPVALYVVLVVLSCSYMFVLNLKFPIRPF